jgi:hypothetical protein
MDIDVEQVLREAELAANTVDEGECKDVAKPPLFVHGSVLADIYPGEEYDPAVMYKLTDPGVLVRTETGLIRWRVRYEPVVEKNWLGDEEQEEYDTM